MKVKKIINMVIVEQEIQNKMERKIYKNEIEVGKEKYKEMKMMK